MEAKQIASGEAFFDRTFPSSLDEMANVLDEALAALETRDWFDAEDMFWARLCLEEALVNAIQHGNCCRKELEVRLWMADDGEYWQVAVYDQGCGFSPDDYGPPDTESLCGRGLWIIKWYMDRVEFNQAEGRLEMRWRKNGFSGGKCHGNP